MTPSLIKGPRILAMICCTLLTVVACGTGPEESGDLQEEETCEPDHHVVDHLCVPCPADLIRQAGDDPLGVDTACVSRSVAYDLGAGELSDEGTAEEDMTSSEQDASMVVAPLLDMSQTMAPDLGGNSSPKSKRPSTMVDPTFSVDRIKNPKTREYYQLLIKRIAIDAKTTSCQGIPEDPDWSDGHKSWNQSACSNNTYIQGRMLQGHIAGLLSIFRLTGDKRLLDEVDRLMELTRSKLATFKGSERYVQWKPFRTKGALDDLSQWPRQFLNEIMAHSLVARVAATLHDNARIPGTPYAKHAEQWKFYLKGKNGYEEKIKQNFHPIFPFIAGAPYGLGQEKSSTWKTVFGSANLAHIYIYHVLYLHYMGRLTGEQTYADATAEMIRNWTRLKVDPVADAYVWPHSTILPDSSPKSTGKLGFASIVYSSMTINAALDMGLDGQPFFAREQTLSRFARTVSHHILDQKQFDAGNKVKPYRRSIGSNRTNWLRGNACDQLKPTLIKAEPNDLCVDIDGVRFFEITSRNSATLASGAFNYISAWPKKKDVRELETSTSYAMHQAAYTPVDPLYKGLEALIFTRLWVEGGHSLAP